VSVLGGRGKTDGNLKEIRGDSVRGLVETESRRGGSGWGGILHSVGEGCLSTRMGIGLAVVCVNGKWDPRGSNSV